MSRLNSNRFRRPLFAVRIAAALPLLALPFALTALSPAAAQQTPPDRNNDPNRPLPPPDNGGNQSDNPDNTGDPSDQSGDPRSNGNNPAGPGTKNGVKKKPVKPVPPPANPLVLRDPDNGSGNSSKNFDDKGNRKEPLTRPVHNFGDWSRFPGDLRDHTHETENLPLFGYNFFTSAREYIEAKRAALISRYAPASQYDANGNLRLLNNNNAPQNRYTQTPGGQQKNYPYDTAPTGTRRANLPGDNGNNGPDNGNNGDYTSDMRVRNSRRYYNDNNAPQDSRRDPAAPDTSDSARYPRNYQATDSGADNSGNPDSPYNDPNRSYNNNYNNGNGNGGNSYGPYSDSGGNNNSGNGGNRNAARYGYGNASGMRNNNNSGNGNNAYPNGGNRNGNNGNYSGNGGYNNGNSRYGNGGYGNGYNGNSGNNGGYGDNGNGNFDPNNPFDNNNDYSASQQRGYRAPFDNSVLDAFNGIADPLEQLYRNVSASVPASYAIAGGDSLTVSYSAPTLGSHEFSGQVDTVGNFNLEGNGRIVLRGMTLDAATQAIKTRLSRMYKSVEVSVQLRELRTIAVTVSGEAVQPGSFTVPAVASALNVLTAAGGPNENGTLRKIEVRRGGKLVGTMDIYNFLTGGAQADIPLQSGDMIIIPPRLSHITITGEVRNPAQFELLDSETLQDALRFAGGIKSSGVSQSVQINTIQPGQERILKTVDIKSKTGAAQTALYDGDTVDVFSVRDTVVNRVTVEGAVNQPNDYALGANMRVADLLQRARGVLPEASTSRADLYRWNPDNTTTLITVDVGRALANDPKENFTLEKWDRLKVYSREEVAYTGLRKMEVRGAVQKPGVYARSANTRVSDLLLRAGGPAPDAYLQRAFLLHQHGDGTFAYEDVNIGMAIQRGAASDPLVEDNDLLTVYNINEANYTPEHNVTVIGEVVAPGIYPLGADMKLSEAIAHAGGFRPGSGGTVRLSHARRRVDAASGEAVTVAVNFDNRGYCAPQSDLIVQDGDVVTVQGDGAFQKDVQTITITGAVQKPGPVPIMKKGMRMSEAIALAGGLRPEAYPEGAEFYRNPDILVSTGQKTILQTISAQMDLLNASQLKREQAKSAVELAKAAGSATTQSGGIGGLGGLTGSAPAQNTAGSAVAQTQLSNKELATAARQFKDADLAPNDNIAVNLPEALRKPGGFEDVILADGDRIVVPETPTTVQVIGAVYHSSGVQYTPNQNLQYYVEHAGGYVTDAAKDRILIIRRGGGVLPATKAGKLRPGDLIFVPTRVQAEKISSNHNAFDDIFKTVTNTALSAFVITRLLP